MDPTIQGTASGSPILGHSHIQGFRFAFFEQLVVSFIMQMYKGLDFSCSYLGGGLEGFGLQLLSFVLRGVYEIRGFQLCQAELNI